MIMEHQIKLQVMTLHIQQIKHLPMIVQIQPIKLKELQLDLEQSLFQI